MGIDEVEIAAEPAGVSDAPWPVLLERDEPLEQLRDALAAARDGTGSLAMIEGPAGIGKTKLLQAVTEQALIEGFECLTARAGELERGYPFGVVRQLFEPFLSGVDDVEELTRGAASLARSVFDGFEADDVTPTANPEFSRLHGLYWLLANVSERRPVCLVVDDLQWADQPSAHFLSYVAPRLEGLPVALVFASRPSQEGPAGVSEHPNLRLIRPAPLSVEATGEVVRSRFNDVSPEVCAAVREATGGNPFLVTELLREIEDRQGGDGEIRIERIRLLGPERIARAVISRVQHIGAKGVSLTEAVAILGDGAPISLAARLAELDTAEASPIVDDLVEAGVLSSGRPLSFAHPIVRTAVYEQIPYGRREVTHMLAARLLREEGAPSEIVATQLLSAEVTDADWVADSLLEAADVAISRGAPATASTYLFRALAQARDTATPAIMLKLGLAKVAEGEESAANYLQQAFDEATDPADQALAGLHLAFMLELGSRRLEALEVARRSLFIAGESAPELVSRLQGAVLLMAQGSVETRRRVLGDLNTALELAERVPDPPAVLLAAIAMERSIGRGDAVAGADLGAEALRKGLIEEVTSDAPPVYLAIGSLVLADRFDEALEWYRVALANGSERGSALGCSLSSAFRSWTRVTTGDLLGADSDARSVLETVPPGFVVEPVAVASLTTSLVLRGKVEEAVEALDAFDVSRHDVGHVLFQLSRLASARVLIAAGQPAAAQSQLQELEAWEREWKGAPDGWCQIRVQSAIAHHALGELQDARRYADDAVEAARGKGSPTRLGNALRVRALVGEPRERTARLQEACSVLATSKAAVDRAAGLIDLGAELRRSGQARDAREPLAEGLALAQKCGAIPLVDRASSESEAAGLKPRAPGTDGIDALTPAERRVAELAVTGNSNPEIAQSLFVTRKTVETHLGSVYRKLGINSRAQLAPRMPAASGDALPSGGVEGLQDAQTN